MSIPTDASGPIEAHDEPMTTDVAPRAATAPLLIRLGTAALGLALFSAAMWGAWLGWDQEYHLVDGVEQGPYRAWQVVGCGVTIVVGAVAAHLWARTAWTLLVLPAVATVGFAVPWTLEAAGSDDSGLFVLGLMLLVIGMGVGLTLVLAVVTAVSAAVNGARRSPSRP